MSGPFDDEEEDLPLPPPRLEDWPAGLSTERPKPAKPNGEHPAPPLTLASAPPLDWPDLSTKEPPARQWAIKGWLGFGHVTLLVGQGGIGKTLLAQQMASCMSLGLPFIGDVARPLKSLMWACEDDHDELWRRQIHLARWCKAGLEAFHENLVIIPRSGKENTLASTEFGKLMFTPLIGQLSEQAADLGAEIVIIDNAGQTYGGGENDRHAVTAFLNALVGALPGRAILLLAHPSRSAGSEFSGSSAWENVARTRLYLGATLPGEKPDADTAADDKVRYLSRRKANYSPKDWRRMTYADGALTPDAPETDGGGGLIASIKAGRSDRIILDGLAKLATMGIHGTDGKRSANFLPKLLAEYHLDEGVQSRDLTAAMRALMVEGRLKRAKVGFSESRNAIVGLVSTIEQ